MKKLWRILKWLLSIVAGLVLIVIACWWLLPDEQLNPNAERLIALPPSPPVTQNAYFMIWGLRASPEIDAHIAGQHIVAAHQRLLATKSNIGDFKIDPFLGTHPLSFPSSHKRYCDIEKQRCLAVYQGMRPQMEADGAKYALYLERYRAIRSYAQFSETAMTLTPASPLPPYMELTRLSDMVDASVALRLPSPATQEAAIDELGAEIASWRRIVVNSDSLITQMISVAVLQRKYRLASEIMTAYPELVRHYPAKMAQITLPLPGKVTNLIRALGGEFRFVAYFYRNIEHMNEQTSGDDIFSNFFNSIQLAGGYRTNATVNEAYARYWEGAQLYAKTPKEVLAGHTALSLKQNEFDPWTLNAIIYNPIGKILVNVAMLDYSDYSFRLYDLVGLSRLIDIQRRIIEGNIDPEKLTEFLAGTGPNLMDPYTEEPMQWNATQKTIYFAGHGKRFLNAGCMQVELDSKKINVE